MLKDLCDLGYEVTFIPTDMQASPGHDSDLQFIGVRVITRDSGYEHAEKFVEEQGHQYGAYYLIRVDVAELILPAARRAAPSARIIFHSPDLYSLRETREADVLQDAEALTSALRTHDRELTVMRSVDRVVLVSVAELQFLQKELPGVRFSVFPALYAPVAPAPTGFAPRRNIFFLGGFKHKPNVNAVEWFAIGVWPRIHAILPDVEFHIVGAEAPKSVVDLGSLPGIRVVGYAPDLNPILESMRLGVAPLRYGAGIKGKVAVTMGAGVPCVCTSIAVEGMGIVDGAHARVADDPRSFADAVVSLYTDETLWMRLSSNGRALVQDQFSDPANRAAFLAALNDARALPILLFVDYCQAAAPIALSAYDASVDVEVSIIVPVHNQWPLTGACLNSIALTSAGSGVRYEVILADDGSIDETTRATRIFPGLRIVKTPSNLGFLHNCNNAAKHARGRYILFFSNDMIVLPGWLKALYRAMEHDADIAIAGSKLLGADGTVQDGGGVVFSDATARK
jgi:glycosyltransferase involved in cell wall biosynthesis